MNIVSKYNSVPHESTLKTTGKLTPEEFIAAGDCLVANCPVWSWASAPKGRELDCLPPDKQFLQNKRVICQSRAQDFSKVMDQETDIGDGWIQSGESVAQQEVNLDEDDEEVDLDEIDIDSIEPTTTAAEAPKIEFRTYDITICYDKYYNVPHVFLYGVDSNGTPLTLEQMHQDISSDHVGKTVTYEQHPFLMMKQLSIHPCQHAHVMLGLVARLNHPENFCAPSYYFLFLKFIHTVIPTIDISTPSIDFDT